MKGTEECLMRGHLATLVKCNAVSHFGHQGLGRPMHKHVGE